VRSTVVKCVMCVSSMAACSASFHRYWYIFFSRIVVCDSTKATCLGLWYTQYVSLDVCSEFSHDSDFALLCLKEKKLQTRNRKKVNQKL
jgi:hypothetical protein